MQDHKKHIFKKIFLFFSFFISLTFFSQAQVSSVEFGKNRIQYKNFKWQFYQSRNFNSYFNQNGQEIAKYVLQIAEEELPAIEKFVEYSLQRRANVVIYNNFNDLLQSNIGLGIDWQNNGGLTKLVNNKMVVYFDGNHANLRRQIREGIANVLTQNILFGDDLGEVAGNQALLDLPQWLIDGYIAYVGENWSPALDDELKSEILSGDYKNFYQFAFERPLLAGHAFWYYIEERYKKENTTYLLYLARVYKSLNRASAQVTKKRKFKDVLSEFMTYQEDKYDKDIRKRKNYPKGSEITSLTVGKRKDYFHFNVNPNKRNGSFAVVKYDQGQYKLILNEEDKDKVLLKFGSKAKMGEINPNYPMMAWDPKGTRLSVLYEEEGRIKMFVYDVITRVKPYKRDLTNIFNQVEDMKYMRDSRTLLFSAVKDGHTDIFTYDIENEIVKRVTNDVFDDLDPSFVAFPNKDGIIFVSNRPSPSAKGSDTALLRNHFNVFLITDFATNKPELNQITQLTDLKFGNARFPTQYNNNHFTFVSDENGVGNRYAGFFTTEKEGLDTLVIVGNDILRNPDLPEIDSLLKVHNQLDVDSIAVVSVTKDSAYVFPLTNYASSLRETREAGDNNQVSEVTRQSDDKILYKLKIDENTLRRRNLSVPPTTYMQTLMEKARIAKGQETSSVIIDTLPAQQDVFQNEFKDEKSDTSANKKLYPGIDQNTSSVLSEAKLYDYKPKKFATQYIVAGFNNNVLGSRYQLYQNGSGPIRLTSDNGINGMIRMGVADIMEDIKISGGFRLSTNLKDNDWLFEFSNLKKRVDWGATYYRSVEAVSFTDGNSGYPGKIFSNLYQGNISYPFSVTKSVRFNFGVRRDRAVVSTFDGVSLSADDFSKSYGLLRAEYVYDNTLNPAQNIWDGVRYKVYADWNAQISKLSTSEGRNTSNIGFDARAYYPIYRNFIWAGRVAGDFSFGNQKFIYYLGGIDNWIMFGSNTKTENGKQVYRYFNPNNRPDPDADYAFQSLAVNLRGFIQNAANGNNATVINSEFRLPVFTTFFSKPINNAFIRNFQLIQFIDLGSAWNGAYDKIGRPSLIYTDPSNPTVQVQIKAPGIGPFLGGYGFGARTTLLGYFLKIDAGWPMNGFFRGKPIYYFSMGLDF